MIFSTITFWRAGLEDPSQSGAESIPTGLTCAKWIISWLDAFGADDFDQTPVAEDWGYAIRVSIGPDAFLLGVANAFEDDANVWRIVLGDNLNRGFFPWTQKRRGDQLARLSDFIERSLRTADGVSNVEVEGVN